MAKAMSGQEAPERILKAATRLFYDEGIRAVGVDAVAAAAGVTKRTLYYHFDSKDALVTACLERRAREAAEAPDLSPEAATAAVLARFDDLHAWFRTDRFRGCPFVNAVTELGIDDHPAVSIARAFKSERRRWFAQLLARAGAKEPDALAAQLMLLVDGCIVAALVRGTAEPAVEARTAAHTLLRAAGLLSGSLSRGEADA